jgi:hypothetical protein
MLLQALAQEGVEVDPVTLFASLATPIGRNGTAIGMYYLFRHPQYSRKK